MAYLTNNPEYIKILIGNDLEILMGLVVCDEKDRPQAIANKILMDNLPDIENLTDNTLDRLKQ